MSAGQETPGPLSALGLDGGARLAPGQARPRLASKLGFAARRVVWHGLPLGPLPGRASRARRAVSPRHPPQESIQVLRWMPLSLVVLKAGSSVFAP